MAAADFSSRGLRTLAVLAVAAIGAVAVSLPLLARKIDIAERTREIRRADAGLAQIGNDALQHLRSVANWDTAVVNLDNRFDPEWAQDMLVSGLGSDVTARLVAVYDGENRTIFVREHAVAVAPGRAAALQRAAAGLIGVLRAREAARAGAARPAARPHGASDWIDGAVTALVQGQPCLIQASLVGPDKGTVPQRHARAPILLYASDLRADVLPDLRDHLLLQDPRITEGPGHVLPAFLPLRGPGGTVTATLQWTPVRPGADLLISALPALLSVLAALTAAVVVAYRQGLSGARKLMASERRAQHVALHDGLTGMANRTLLHDRLGQALARAARHGGDVTVLLVDLDRFKIINDTYGHIVGDQLIQQVAGRLGGICRASDTCARLGGDEFVIVAVECGAKAAAALADRVLEMLSVPVVLASMEVQTGASIGLSISFDGAGDALDMMRQADLALHKAKNQGRGRYRFFEPEMDVALQDRRVLEHDLRQAIAAGALEVHYQPQYDRERPVALEALVRWTHPERGAVPPVVFVPLAEECGLIEALGRLVLSRAFADSQRWPGLKIAINISATQLLARGFVDGLRELTREAGVRPQDFELEITEGVLMDDTPHIHAMLAAIRAIGFSLAIDDFGTGFSSLSYLHRFPIGKLKIDRSFVMRLPDDTATCAVVHAIIRLAHALKLDTTAEGVETPEQLSKLASFGCRLTQGYLTGRPMTADAIDALMHDQGTAVAA